MAQNNTHCLSHGLYRLGIETWLIWSFASWLIKVLVRDAVLAKGSSACKLTNMVAGRIQFFGSYWTEGLSSFPVVGERPATFHS